MDKTKLAADVTICGRECGIGNKPYAGVWNGEICLCGNDITGMKKLSSIACTAEQDQGFTVYNAALNVEMPDLSIDISPACKLNYLMLTQKRRLLPKRCCKQILKK